MNVWATDIAQSTVWAKPVRTHNFAMPCDNLFLRRWRVEVDICRERGLVDEGSVPVEKDKKNGSPGLHWSLELAPGAPNSQRTRAISARPCWSPYSLNVWKLYEWPIIDSHSHRFHLPVWSPELTGVSHAYDFDVRITSHWIEVFGVFWKVSLEVEEIIAC